MAKDINQIITDMDAAQAAEPDLAGLTSPSASAVHRLFKYVVAYSFVALYKAWDAVYLELQLLLAASITGTRAWYVYIAKAYSGGALVAKASCIENGTKVILKCAKVVSGVTAQLTTLELAGLTAYINEKKVAGTDIDVLSQTADLLSFVLDIQYTGVQATVEAAVIAALKNHLNNIPFGEEFSKTLLITDLLQVTGVLNAYVTTLEADTGLGYVLIPGNLATPDAGYWEVGQVAAVDLITLNMYL